MTWNVGRVAITRVLETNLLLRGGQPGTIIPHAKPDELRRIPWLQPNFVTDALELKLCVQAFLVVTPSVRVLVDPCIGNGKHRSSPLHNMLETPFLQRLAGAGCPPEAVDIVVCTHLHLDHVGWNTRLVDGRWVPTFPNARYLFGRHDYDYYSSVDDAERQAMLADSVVPVIEAGLSTLVAMDAVIAPEVRFTPTPGHSPGHASIVIDSAGERAVICGDVMHHPCQLARPGWSSGFDDDGDAASVTRRAFLAELADTRTMLIGTHFPPPVAGRVISDGESYRLVPMR